MSGVLLSQHETLPQTPEKCKGRDHRAAIGETRICRPRGLAFGHLLAARRTDPCH
jgi:hypothetical protein